MTLLSQQHILVVGANGGIGRQSVELALLAGHHVTALMRRPENLPLSHPNLKKIQGDVMDPHTLDNIPAGQDTVISALGVKGGFFGDKPTTLYSEGNANLIRYMHTRQIKRAFFISASAIEISPVMPFFARLAAKYIVQKLLRHMYTDLREMERIVKDSGLDWTIIRPPRLTNGPVTGHYRFSINTFLKNALSISRADLAHFMLNNTANEALYHTMVEIAY